MARMRSKKKRSGREDFMLKEQKKVEATLDPQTMVCLSKFYNKGIIEKLGFIIARGKESDVYLAIAGSDDIVKGETYVIVKFFRIETSTFFNMADYIVGDPRFKKISNSKIEIVKTWCKKEYGNLEIARKAHVNAPKPYMFNGTILAMQFIGDEDSQARQLKDTRLSRERAEAVLEKVLESVKRLYAAKLVHGDLSEYNILMKGNTPYLIDFGQAVVIRHPNAMRFLQRDIKNVLSYFRKCYGLEREFAEVYRNIIS